MNGLVAKVIAMGSEKDTWQRMSERASRLFSGTQTTDYTKKAAEFTSVVTAVVEKMAEAHMLAANMLVTALLVQKPAEIDTTALSECVKFVDQKLHVPVQKLHANVRTHYEDSIAMQSKEKQQSDEQKGEKSGANTESASKKRKLRNLQ